MAEQSLVEMPSELLVNLARKIGIDPYQYERGELIDQFKQRTEDYRTVLDYKKARRANREFNQETAQALRERQLHEAAQKNRTVLTSLMARSG
ncbi:MAG: hypothetical protein ACRD5H_01240 [Nitrososphaerales archaeon]